MKALVALAAAALVATASVAAAPHALVPSRGTLLGGGAITSGYNPYGGYGLGFVTVAVAHRDGRSVRFYGDWNGNCPGYAGPVTATFVQRVPLRKDGSFAGHGPIPSRIAAGTFTFKGRFTGPRSVEGTGRVVFRYKPGDVVYSCDTGNVSWEARADLPAYGKPKPKPNGAYYGSTSQSLPLVLRLAPNGSSVAQAALLWNVHCQRNKAGIGRGTVSPPMALTSSGRFASVSQYVDAGIAPGMVATVTSYRSGRFGAASAAGTWRIHMEIRSTSNNELLDICDSGVIRWHASL